MLNDFVFGIYGTVAYTDGSVGSFAVDYFGGDVVGPDPTSTDFQQLYASKKSEVDALLAALPGNFTINPAKPAVLKSIADYTFNVYGIVTYADGTKSPFGVTRNVQAGNIVQGKTTSIFYKKIGVRPSLDSSSTTDGSIATPATTGIQEDGSGAGAGGVSIAKGDITINGLDICAASGITANDATLSGANLGGAKDFATRINSLTDTVGASAVTSFAATDIQIFDTLAGQSDFATKGGTIKAGTIDVTTNKLTINGVVIGGATILAGDSSGTLVAAINAKSASTGVVASVASSTLTLTASDGRDIVVSTAGSAGNTCFGLGSGKNLGNLRVRGVVTLTSRSPITIAGNNSARVMGATVVSSTSTVSNTSDFHDVLLNTTSQGHVSAMLASLGGGLGVAQP